jgi:hypothetical protein
VTAVGSTLVLSIKAAYVRDACTAAGQWRKLEELRTASLAACTRDNTDKTRVRKVFRCSCLTLAAAVAGCP